MIVSVAVIVGIIVGGAVGFLLANSKSAVLTHRLASTEENRDALARDLEAARNQQFEESRSLSEQRERNATLEATLESERKTNAAMVEELSERVRQLGVALESNGQTNTELNAKNAGLEQQLRDLARQSDRVTADLAKNEDELSRLREKERQIDATLAATSAQLQAAKQLIADDEKRIEIIRNDVAKIFTSEAAAALADREKTFEKTVDERRTAIDALLNPISEQLGALNKLIVQFDTGRQTTQATLTEKIENLQATQQDVVARLTAKADAIEVAAGSLSTALRNPQVRGSWGERSLENVLEITGMSEFCDVELQERLRDELGTGRPDAIVRLPRSDGKRVPIDAKAPGTFFLTASQAPSDSERSAALREHASAVLRHAEELADRNYSRYPEMVDFVFLFLPNEGMLHGALTALPDLYERAYQKGVIITSPMTLSLYLEGLAAGWRLERQERNAAEIATAAKELYRRLGIFADHFIAVGSHLQKAARSYDDAVSSYRRRLLVQAQKMEELGAGEVAQKPRVEGLVPRNIVIQTMDSIGDGSSVESEVAETPEEPGTPLSFELPS